MVTPKQLNHTPLADGMFFGEGPRYRDGLLYLSDMTGKTIYTIDRSGTKKVLREVPNQPNGMCFAADGSLIYSSMFDAKVFRRDTTGKETLYADLSDIMTGYCGDMVIDSVGRIYLDDVGARVLHGEKPRPGQLLMVDTDGSVSVAEKNLMFPNALCITPDGKKLFCAETFGEGLLKWDIGPKGELSNRELHWSPASISPNGMIGHTPHGIVGIDGGCMDSEGGIWLSMLGLEKYVRVNQEGNVTHEIHVKGHATACTLGGEDGKTLYLVTNWYSEEEGSLFTAMVGKRTKCSVSYAVVDTPKGNALP